MQAIFDAPTAYCDVSGGRKIAVGDTVEDVLSTDPETIVGVNESGTVLCGHWFKDERVTVGAFAFPTVHVPLLYNGTLDSNFICQFALFFLSLVFSP